MARICRKIPTHSCPRRVYEFRCPKVRAPEELIQEFDDDIAKVEKTLALDPFTLVAKYCNDFVMIHPFLDGNGRMCRLILNAILLKYAGDFVCLGESISLFREELGRTWKSLGSLLPSFSRRRWVDTEL